jgi:hypothetical protein
MNPWPPVVVHGLSHATLALRPGFPVVLLSAPAAAGYAGALWWRELIAAARALHPATPALDILDCGAAPGHALAALRAGQRVLILDLCPAFAAVASAAETWGAHVLPLRPPALDLAERGAERRLRDWLA